MLRPEVSRRGNQALVSFRREENKSESQQTRVVTSNSDYIVKLTTARDWIHAEEPSLYILSSAGCYTR